MVRFLFSRAWLVSMAALSCMAVVGCAGSQPEPTAQDTEHTKKIMESPTTSMPPTMLQGGSPEEQLKAATGATPGAVPGAIPPATGQ